MQYSKWILNLAVVAVAAVGGAAELLYSVDFNAPEVKAAIARQPLAKVVKDFEGTQVLSVTVPPDGIKPGMMTVAIPVDLAAFKLNGDSLYAEFDLKMDNVTKPRHDWNGAKSMLVYAVDGKEIYPSLNPIRRRAFGTYDWRRLSTVLVIPAQVKRATLMLGLQESSGTVEFRNIRFYRGTAAPKSTLAAKSIPQARYTGSLPVGRGVMSPNRFKPEDFKTLQEWNVNLIRWQLNRSLAKDYTVKEYADHTAKKLDELDKVLPVAAQYGVKVVIDLHPFEGGKLILENPEGRAYLVEIWKEIAGRYKGNPAVWGYDILNEPHSRNLRPGSPSWPEIAKQVIQAIRSIDPEIPIIIESDQMAKPDQIEFLPVFDSPNIIYSIHMYSPGALTHQLNAKATPHLGYPDAARGWNKDFLRQELAKAREFQLKTGARIYVGEFSVIRWAPGGAQYLRDLIDLFEEYGWDWSYHAFREWSGWSVEHSDDPTDNKMVPNTGRKEVLLDAFKKNQR